MNKGTPQLEVIAYPTTTYQRRQIDAFVVADIMADLLTGTSSTAGVVVRGATGGEWQDWTRMGNGLTLSNVGFARFKKDGTVSYSPSDNAPGTAGFFVLPKSVPMNSIIAGEEVDVGFADRLEWQADEGSWRTVQSLRPHAGNGGSAIFNTGSESVFRAQTTTTLPALSSLQFNMSFSGQYRDGNLIPLGRVRYGQDLSFVLRHGMPPALERRIFDDDGNPTWKPVRILQGKANLYGNTYRMAVRNLGGRLVWECNDQAVWMVDADEPDKNGDEKVKQWRWSEAPLVVEAENTRVRLEVSKYDHADQTGTITRRIPRAVNDMITATSTPYAGGWQRDDTDMVATSTVGEEYIDVSVTMTPSGDGVLSPFLQTYLLRYAPAWTSPTSGGVDISRAVTRCNLTLASPPSQAGASGTLEIDRYLLSKIINGFDNVRDYCPVTIRAQWRSDAGVAQGWKKLWRGYFYGLKPTNPAYNEYGLTVTLRGPLMRLTGANAIVDHRFHPLGMILLDELRGSARNGGYNEDGTVRFNPELPHSKPLYSGDCIKEIVRTVMGPNAANSINGNGNMRRFFPSTQIPLWDMSNALGSYLPLAAAFGVNLQSGNLDDGIPFPPPFDDDCYSWANRFAQDDFADLFEGRVDREDYDGLIYGRFLNYTANAKLWSIADAVSVTSHEDVNGHVTYSQNLGDLDYLMENAMSETRPESDINRILTRADFANSDQSPLFPAMRMGEARLPASDFNADVYSWERTKVIRQNLAVMAGGVELLAGIALKQIGGMKKQWPSLTFRGEAGVLPNDVIQPIMNSPQFSPAAIRTAKLPVTNSDPTLGINERVFRATSVSHDILPGDTWTTSTTMRPLTITEDIRFRHVNFLPIPVSYFQ